MQVVREAIQDDPLSAWHVKLLEMLITKPNLDSLVKYTACGLAGVVALEERLWQI